MTFGERTRIAVGQAFHTAVVSPVAAATWPNALRRGGLVGLIVLISFLLDQPGVGFSVAIGALNLGLVDGVVPRRSLAKVFALVTIGTGVICFLSVLAAHTWWSLLLLVVLAYGNGCLAGSGFVAMHVALVSLITGVVFSNDPGDLSQALTMAAWVVLGCLLQSASGLLAWRYERDAAMRRTLGALVQSVARLVEAGEYRQELAYIAAKREVAAERMLAGARFDSATHDHYARIIREINWLRLETADWLTSPEVKPAQGADVVGVLAQIDVQLRRPHHRHDRPIPSLPRTEDPIWNELASRLDELAAAACAPAPAVAPRGTPRNGVADKAESGLSLRDRVEPWLALFKPGAAMSRHGLRLAIAIGIAQTLTLALDLDRGYWLSVTVLICMQPDFAATLTHGSQRAVGTFFGVLVVSVIVIATSGNELVLTLIVIISAPLVMKLQTGNYGIEAFFITCFVAALLESVSPSTDTLAIRLANTILGFAIALAVYLILPRWKSDSVNDSLVSVIEAHRVWALSLLSSLGNPRQIDLERLRDLGRDARNATVKVRPDAESALIEPHHIAKDPRAALEVLDACQSIGIAAMAVEATLRSRSTSLVASDLASVSSRLDRAMTNSEELLRDPQASRVRAPIASKELPDVGDPACDHALGFMVSGVTNLQLAATRVQANEALAAH